MRSFHIALLVSWKVIVLKSIEFRVFKDIVKKPNHNNIPYPWFNEWINYQPHVGFPARFPSDHFCNSMCTANGHPWVYHHPFSISAWEAVLGPQININNIRYDNETYIYIYI